MLDNDGVLWLSSADEGVYCMNFPKKQFNLLSLSPQSAGRENYATGVRAFSNQKVAISGWAPVGRVFIGWTGTVLTKHVFRQVTSI